MTTKRERKHQPTLWDEPREFGEFSPTVDWAGSSLSQIQAAAKALQASVAPPKEYFYVVHPNMVGSIEEYLTAPGEPIDVLKTKFWM